MSDELVIEEDKKKQKPKLLIEAEAPVVEDPRPVNRRGRKPGSKNKPKPPVVTPPVVTPPVVTPPVSENAEIVIPPGLTGGTPAPIVLPSIPPPPVVVDPEPETIIPRPANRWAKFGRSWN